MTDYAQITIEACVICIVQALIYLILNLTLYYSTYMHPVMYTYKTHKNIFVFRLKIGFFDIEIHCRKCVFFYSIYTEQNF